MALRPEPSRILWVWWCGLHGLVAAAATLVAGPWWLGPFGIVAVAAHGWLRRPRRAPALILVAADGACAVPEWGIEFSPLHERTTVCSYWLRLSFGSSPRRRDIVLCVDQLASADWAHVRASLRRARCDAARVLAGPGKPI